jgi:hypothetical protein
MVVSTLLLLSLSLSTITSRLRRRAAMLWVCMSKTTLTDRLGWHLRPATDRMIDGQADLANDTSPVLSVHYVPSPILSAISILRHHVSQFVLPSFVSLTSVAAKSLANGTDRSRSDHAPFHMAYSFQCHLSAPWQITFETMVSHRFCGCCLLRVIKYLLRQNSRPPASSSASVIMQVCH